MMVKMFTSDKLVYINTYDENIFAQYAHMTYMKINDPKIKSNPFDDALHLSNLDIQCRDLTIVIEFGVSNSSLPKANMKIKPPETILEVYGNPVDAVVSDSQIKDLIDEKAKQFWA